MYIKDLFNDLDVIKEEDSLYVYNGTKVPRVTSILSRMIHNDYLMDWANSLGFRKKKYREALQEAADIGTCTHEAIENFLSNNQEDVQITFVGFKMWWDNLLKNNTVDILGTEQKIVCQWFGGTYDALLKINGKIYLVDWKTSNHVTSNYFLQLSAYRFILYTIYNINIDGCIVLQLNKKEPGFNEFVLDFSNIDHFNFINQCEKTFLSLVYGYYNLSYTNDCFNKIF